MHANLIHYSAEVKIHTFKQILLDLEHGFVHKAKEARHIRMVLLIYILYLCKLWLKNLCYIFLNRLVCSMSN